jgi:hypothetical protein
VVALARPLNRWLMRRATEGTRMPEPGPHRHEGANADTGDATAASQRGTPRWVKVAGVIALVILVMLVVALLSGGKHGPGRHALDTVARPALAFALSAAADHPAPASGDARP